MRPVVRPPLRLPVLLAAAASPILLAYGILLRQFVAIPLLDDYPSILEFAEHFQQLPSASQKVLYLAAAQSNEYKLIFLHALIALQLIAVQHLNFSFLVAVGNLLPLLILVILWLNAFRDEPELSHRLLLFLPVPFLLFQLNYAEAFDWALGSLQNLGVVAFALLSLHLLLRPGWVSFAGATSAAALACTASAGGFLLAPIGALALLSRRRYTAAVVWSIPFLLMSLLYLYKYVRLPYGPHAGAPAMLLFFLSFLGSAYEDMHHRPVPYLSVVLGIASLCAFVAALRHHSRRDPTFLFLSTVFFLGTAGLATVGRAGMGLETSLSARYKIYSDLMLIVTYIALAERTRNSSRLSGPQGNRGQRFTAAALALAISLCAASDIAGYHFLSKRKAQLIRGLQQYQASSGTSSPILNPNATQSAGITYLQEEARTSLTRSLQSGLYTTPALP